MKSIPEDLNKKFNVILIARDSKIKRKHQINLENINNLSNIFSFLFTIFKTFKKKDFRKANITAIIACRLKSTRLRKKALLKVGDLTSIELCLKNILKVENLNHVILATSDLPEDAELKKYTYNDDVIFHVGDPEDVIERYLTAINKYKIDVVIKIIALIKQCNNQLWLIKGVERKIV